MWGPLFLSFLLFLSFDTGCGDPYFFHFFHFFCIFHLILGVGTPISFISFISFGFFFSILATGTPISFISFISFICYWVRGPLFLSFLSFLLYFSFDTGYGDPYFFHFFLFLSFHL